MCTGWFGKSLGREDNIWRGVTLHLLTSLADPEAQEIHLHGLSSQLLMPKFGTQLTGSPKRVSGFGTLFWEMYVEIAQHAWQLLTFEGQICSLGAFTKHVCSAGEKRCKQSN